jgi:hypothetical protein
VLPRPSKTAKGTASMGACRIKALNKRLTEILEKVINRTYHSSGKGGLFPLKHAEKDQTEVELWYQMNTYLVENYYKDEEVI